MKKTSVAIFGIFTAFTFIVKAQTNTFPTSGNVGIGTLSPGSLLTVNGTASVNSLTDGFITLSSAQINRPGGNVELQFNGANAIQFFGNTTNNIVFNPAGGITMNPNLNQGAGTANMFSILPDINQTGAAGWRGIYESVFENTFGSSTHKLIDLGTNSATKGSGTHNTKFSVNNAGVGYFAGNVGIGTTSPASKLDVQGGNATVYNTGSATSLIVGGGATGKTFLSIGTSADAGGYANLQSVSASGSAYGSLILNGAAGKVGIGTTSPDQLLTVNGTIHSTEVKVDLSVPAPDYVFEPTYQLSSLAEIKTYVDKNHHLPEIPSAAEMAKNGLDLGDMNMKLLKKVEELTLHLIEKDKKDQEKDILLKQQQAMLNKLTNQLNALTNKLNYK